MPRKRDNPDAPSRYMTFTEVAAQLGISPRTVRDKVLVTHELPAVDVGNGGDRHAWRIPRAAFDTYCARLEAESAARFGKAS